MYHAHFRYNVVFHQSSTASNPIRLKALCGIG